MEEEEHDEKSLIGYSSTDEDDLEEECLEDEEEDEVYLDNADDGDIKDDEDGCLKFFSKKIEGLKFKNIATEGSADEENCGAEEGAKTLTEL